MIFNVHYIAHPQFLTWNEISRRESDKVTRAGGAWGDRRVCGCGGGVRGVNRLFSGMFCDVGGSFDVCWFETVD